MADNEPIASLTFSTSSTTAETVEFQQDWAGVEIDNHTASADAWVNFVGGTAAADGVGSRRIRAGSTRRFAIPQGQGIVFSIVGNTSKFTVAGVTEAELR